METIHSYPKAFMKSNAILRLYILAINIPSDNPFDVGQKVFDE